MASQTPHFDESIAIVRPEERPWGALIHALGWIPVWGFIINSSIWLYFKNRSRELVFHIQQAIQFQIYVLIPLITWILCSIMIRFIGALSPGLGETLQMVNTFLFILCTTIAGCIGLAGATMVYLGKGFFYPLIGRRVLEGSIKKYSQEI